MSHTYSSTGAGISRTVDDIRAFFDKNGIRGKNAARAAITAEETMSDLVAHAPEGAQMRLSLRAFLGAVTAEISVDGEE